MILEIKNIQKSYKNKQIIKNMTLILKPGIYAFLGPNGAGKSTLMNMLVGLIKADSGSITYDGQDILAAGEKYREIIGYMPQELGLYSSFSGEKLLEYYAALRGVNEPKERIEELLRMVNLWDERKKRVGKYSGGMKRRLGIALALLNDPKILILDEPTAGLDPRERIRFRNVLSQLTHDKIVMVATHIVSDVENISDNCIFIKSGEVVANGSMTELMSCLNDKVWEWESDILSGELYCETNQCATIVKKEGKTRIHEVSADRPNNVAVNVEPELEDAYTFYFGEKVDHE